MIDFFSKILGDAAATVDITRELFEMLPSLFAWLPDPWVFLVSGALVIATVVGLIRVL